MRVCIHSLYSMRSCYGSLCSYLQHDPEPDEGEYYDRDNPDVEQRDSEYMQQYRNDEMMGKQDQAKPGSMGVVPDIHDYSLQENFRHLFTSSLQVWFLHEQLL